MRNMILVTFIILAVITSMTGIVLADEDEDHKIVICHIPPGNPENGHPIEVDEHSWEDMGHQHHNTHQHDFEIGDDKPCGEPPAPVPELSPMILTSAGMLGLLGIVQVSRKLRK
jgi:hypothetical protein